MIDLFSLALCHGLLMLTAWKLLQRPDLDSEPADGLPPVPAPEKPRGWGKRGA